MPMSAGAFRSTFIGDVLVRLNKALGYKNIITINFLGDRSPQLGKYAHPNNDGHQPWGKM